MTYHLFMRKLAERISVRLDPKSLEKLELIRQSTGQNLSEMLRQAIDIYYQQSNQDTPPSSETLDRVGFVGCSEGPTDLAKNFKKYLSEGLRRKA
jgi:hypothetical protein